MRAEKRLSAARVKTILKPGMHPDGGNLYLLVSETGSKSWIFRYARGGRTHDMGLGSAQTFSLDEARARARLQRQLLADGADPLTLRRATREPVRVLTFEAVANEFIASREAGWKTVKDSQIWPRRLENHVYPRLGNVPVSAVDTDAVMRCLKPIWHEKTETANRLRGFIERILDYATVRKYRTGDNPARWNGHIEHLLPSRGEMARSGKVAGAAVRHHPALPVKDLPAFMERLWKYEGRTRQARLTADALKWLVLTAARSGEVRGAGFREVDLKGMVWTIPANRMKAGVEHVVPLDWRVSELVWHSDREGPGGTFFPVSDTAMRRLACTIAGVNTTLHGFRSTFRDWCAETAVTPELAERALAHIVKNRVEAAYNRTTLIEQRRPLMVAWSTFCLGPDDGQEPFASR